MNGRLCIVSLLKYNDGLHHYIVIIMDCNATKGGVDNLDKLVTGYRRKMKNPTLATCDILQHLGEQHVCHLAGVEPRLEQREAPEETDISREALQGIGKTSNPEEATYPKDPSFCPKSLP